MATQQQLREAAYAAGFRGADLDRIVAIALAESGGQESATANTSAEYSVGPLQINLKAGHGISEADARDPFKAMQYAYGLVYETPQSWSHWSVYSAGTHQQYMPGGRDTQMVSQYDPLVDAAIDRALSGGGSTTSLPGSGDVIYNGRGEAFVWSAQQQQYVRQPSLDNPAESADFQSPDELARLAEDRRQADARLGYNYADLGQRAYEYGQDQAFAKEQWLFTKENTIRQLELQEKEYAAQLAQNARDYTLQQQTLQFNRDKFAFESSLSLTQEARATQAQIFGQEATVAGMQLEMASIAQRTRELNAQLQQEVALFNAGKAADVSMFNIDQQTKTAMFNAEGAFNASTFNAEMGFNVQKANVENERLRQQQLIDVASRISEAAKDPGDRGALASLILALGGGNLGGTDAALANADLRTDDSLTPLEAMLRQREDIVESERHPFSFDPVTFEKLAPPPAAVFNPATAAQAPMPDFSGVNLPKVNTAPFDPSSIKTSAPAPPPTYDSTKQNYIASGNTTAPGQQFVNDQTGTPLTAEQRAQIPDYALQSMIDAGLIPPMERGGNVSGAYIGDEKGAEMHIPMLNGGQRSQAVIPADTVDQWREKIVQHRMGKGRLGGPPPEASIPAGETPQYPNGQPAPGQQPGGGMAAIMQWIQSMRGGAAPGAGAGQPGTGNPWEGVWARHPLAQRAAKGQQMASDFMARMQANPPQQPAGTPAVPEWMQRHFPNGQIDWSSILNRAPGMSEGGIVEGPYMGSEEGDSVNIPIPGTDMTIIMPKPKGKAKGMKKMATGGIYDPESEGRSMYEGLLSDTDRTRAWDFLNNATNRAAAGTPFNPRALPTPTFFSSPGTSSYLTDLGAALSAIGRGIPPGYFKEQAERQRPAGYSEGVIGRSR